MQTTRWQSDQHIYQDIVTGSIRLVEALTASSCAVIEEAKRMLLIGCGLPSSRFADLMISAMDRGRQLIRSTGLAVDLVDQDPGLSSEQDAKDPFSPQAPSRPNSVEQRPMVSPTSPGYYMTNMLLLLPR